MVLGAVVALLAVSWAAVAAIDIGGWGGDPSVELEGAPVADRLRWILPMYVHLFNDRPVEWSQWVLLAWAVLACGYLAGRLAHEWRVPPDLRSRAATFFLVLGAGLGLMLLEEAGDIRHRVAEYVNRLVGEDPAVPVSVLVDVPIFAAIAAVPLWAVARHGRQVWRAPSVRPWLLAALVLYATASAGSALGTPFYSAVGGWIDEALLGGRLPPVPGWGGDEGHYTVFVDSAIEETIELLAATSMLGVVLGFARDLRFGRLDDAPGPAATGPGAMDRDAGASVDVRTGHGPDVPTAPSVR
jgi:hypothetical protein